MKWYAVLLALLATRSGVSEGNEEKIRELLSRVGVSGRQRTLRVLGIQPHRLGPAYVVRTLLGSTSSRPSRAKETLDL